MASVALARGIVHFDCGSDAVLYCTSSRELFVLNDTAAVVYRALSRGTPMPEICDGLAAATKRAREQIEYDVRQLIHGWRELGWRRAQRAPSVASSAGARRRDNRCM